MIAFTVMLMVWMFQGRGPQAAHAPQEPLHAEMAVATTPVPLVEALQDPIQSTDQEIVTVPEGSSGPGAPDIAAFETSAEPVAIPAWRRFAALAEDPGGKPMVAIVIDDVGMSKRRTQRAIELNAAVTLAFLPYADNLPEMTRRARAQGHEVMVHMPMEALDPNANPGPGALTTEMDPIALRAQLIANLDRFEGHVGFNNHMGSRFTADATGMEAVMTVAAERGLLFLDSRTTNDTQARELAERHNVPLLSRDVFLDNVITAQAIKTRLRYLKALAVRRGAAIGICHPHKTTLKALEEWMAEEEDVVFVPVSALVERGLDIPQYAQQDPTYTDSSGY